MLRTSLFVFMLWGNALEARQDPVPVKIQATASHSISPYIYGFGTYMHEDRDKEGIWDLRPTLYRWGGNTSTRFNYKTNSWNAAQDWFFHNYSSQAPNMIEAFMEENAKKGVASEITLPMLGWVAKDGSSCSFPRSVFPRQDKWEGDCGNGQKDGKDLPIDPKRTSIPITPEFVADWVRILKKKFGSHPHFYIMDNEPMLWHSTHRDVQAQPMSYDSYLKIFLSYAKAVRRADPEAVIVGPAEWGWLGMQNSAMDMKSSWNSFKQGTDRKKHGDKPFLEWFLEQVAAVEKKEKMSLLDVIDVHYYPETDRWPSGDEKSPAVRKALLQSTRSLWDKSYKDNSWIDEKIYFIPRLQAMAEKFKPDAKFAIGEYNFRSEKDVSGALAQAETLGIFARSNLYAATYWDFPSKEGTHRSAFQMFRNFDGKGAAFGSRWLNNSIGTQDDMSVYSARDERRLTVVLLNKANDRQTFELDLGEFAKAQSARVIAYTGQGSKGMSRKEEKLKIDPQAKKVRVPTEGLSMQIVEVTF